MNTSVLDKLGSRAKKAGSLILCTAMAVTIVSCGGKTQPEGTDKASSKPATSAQAQKTPDTSASGTVEPSEIKVDVTQLARAIFEAGDYIDELDVLEDEMFDAVFPTVDLALVSEKCAYVGSAASAEQIVVVRVNDEAAAAKVKDALSQKLSDDIAQNEDYLPQEVSKLKNPILIVKGQYVVLCVSNDNKKIEDVLKKNGIMS